MLPKEDHGNPLTTGGLGEDDHDLKSTDQILYGDVGDGEGIDGSKKTGRKPRDKLTLRTIWPVDEFNQPLEDRLWDLWLSDLALIPKVQDFGGSNGTPISEEERQKIECRQMAQVLSIHRKWSQEMLAGGYSVAAFCHKFAKIVHEDHNFPQYRRQLVKKFLTQDWRVEAEMQRSARLKEQQELFNTVMGLQLAPDENNHMDDDQFFQQRNSRPDETQTSDLIEARQEEARLRKRVLLAKRRAGKTETRMGGPQPGEIVEPSEEIWEPPWPWLGESFPAAQGDGRTDSVGESALIAAREKRKAALERRRNGEKRKWSEISQNAEDERSPEGPKMSRKSPSHET